MKKRSILSFLCVLLLFSCGCGSLRHYKEVTVNTMFIKEQLVLDLPNQSTGEPGYFRLDSPLDDETLQAALPEGAQLKQQAVGWIIWTENGNGTQNLFYLYNIPNPEVDWYGYEITQMAVTLETSDFDSLIALLFPIQNLINMETNLFLDTDYEINTTLDELTAFYQDSGWYDFDTNDSSLGFTGYRQQPDWGDSGGYSPVKDDAFPRTIHYREE